MRNTHFGIYPFQCKIYCALYTYVNSGVDRKDKPFFSCLRCVYVDVDKEVELFFFVRCV